MIANKLLYYYHAGNKSAGNSTPMYFQKGGIRPSSETVSSIVKNLKRRRRESQSSDTTSPSPSRSSSVRGRVRKGKTDMKVPSKQGD